MTEAQGDLFDAVRPTRDARPSEQVARIHALLAGGADVSAFDEQGASVLHRAVRAPYSDGDPLPSLEVVRALLESGADVHACDRNGVTPVSRAVVLNDTAPAAAIDRSVEILELLAEYGAQFDVSFGASFAHHSCTAAPVYAFLLDHGAPTAVADQLGNTPLHATVRSARPRLVELLLQRGVDTGAVNQLGQTALGIALQLPEHNKKQRQVRSQIVNMLKAAGAPAYVYYPTADGGPLPIDMDAIRRVAKQLRGESDGDPGVGDKSCGPHEPHSVRLSWLRRAFDRRAGGGLMMHRRNQREEAARGSGDPSGAGSRVGRDSPAGGEPLGPVANNPSLQKFLKHTYSSYQDFIAALKRTGGPDCAPWMLELCRRVLGDTCSTRTMVGEQELRQPFVHHGDLIVKGRLSVVCPFVVTGSLTVEGFLADAGPDSNVAVGGNVNAHAVYTDGEMYVEGDIEAEVVYGHYNDNTLHAGTIRARLVIEDEHDVQADVEAEHYFDIDTYRQGYGEGVQEQLRELLVDEVFTQDDDDDEARLDHRSLYSHLWEGKAVFRPVD